jgi:hypothetical protein
MPGARDGSIGQGKQTKEAEDGDQGSTMFVWAWN